MYNTHMKQALGWWGPGLLSPEQVEGPARLRALYLLIWVVVKIMVPFWVP